MLLIVKTKRGYEISCECGRVLVIKTCPYFDVNDFPEICDGCGLSVFGTFVTADKLLPTPKKKTPQVSLPPPQGVPGDGVSASPGFSLPSANICAECDRIDSCSEECVKWCPKGVTFHGSYPAQYSTVKSNASSK